MTNQAIDDRLMDRIAKIQALAIGGTRGEAEVAAAKLADLMARHNISVLDLDKYAEGKGQKVKEQMFWMSARSNWRRELLNQVVRANFCRMIFYPGSREVTVVGYDHNIIVSIEMYHWLESIFEDIVAKEREMLKTRSWTLKPVETLNDYFYRETEEEMYEKSRRQLLQNRQRWSNGFRFGMVAGVAAAMKKARESVRREVGESKWALVPVMEQEIEDYLKAQNVGKDTRKLSVSQAAREHGYKVGRGINVDPQLRSGSANLAIGE